MSSHRNNETRNGSQENMLFKLSNAKKQSPLNYIHPGKVINKSLVINSRCNLKEGLVEHHDYEAVS